MAFQKSTSITTDTAIYVTGYTGGGDGKVVILTAPNTTTDASNANSATQLNAVFLKRDNKYYISGLVTGFTSLTPGVPYYLSTSGNITATPPTPSASVRLLYVGFPINTTDFLFRPLIPIGG